MSEGETWETYNLVIDELNARDIAFVDIERLVEWMDTTHRATPINVVKLASRFKNTVFIGGDFEVSEAAAAIKSGACHGVPFGRRFLSNPDLVYRIKNGIDLASDNAKTWYTYPNEDRAVGYTDYEFAKTNLAPGIYPK